MGSEESASGDVEAVQYQDCTGREYPRFSSFKLDGEGYLAVYPQGEYSNCIAVFCKGASGG